MRRIFTLLVLILAINIYANAQVNKLAANVGYEYMHISSGYLGAEYRLNSNNAKNTQGPLNIGVGTYMYSNNGKFAVAPEVHVNQTWKHFLSTELSASTQNFKPSLGISLFNLTRFQFGYSFPFNDSDFKGFYFGFHILIGRSAFYDEITIF
ncbi:MAG: hypothetical protein ACOH2V_05875 [Candidatus Saccharimonadaceae bacterium]